MNHLIPNNITDELEDLDSSWLQEFENIDNEYKSYYTEELSFIKVSAIYINKDNNIEKIQEEKLLLKVPGFLQREELLGLIKHNCIFNKLKYSLLAILKFNINIEPMNLKTFLRSKNNNIGALFLQSVKNIDTIKFDKSISIFHDINELFIIFHEKINKENIESKLIDYKQSHTKKVFIHSIQKKKTKRKQFKEISS